MTFQVDDVVERLADAGVRLDRRLTEADLTRIERRFGFAFAPDHRELLATALPVGDSWVNWRHAAETNVRERLRAPVEGVVFDVRVNDFWWPGWGERPADAAAAEERAREFLAGVPVLVPLYSHRYLPAAPAAVGSPVFSVQRTDVIVYGGDLPAYVSAEFGTGPVNTLGAGLPRVDFWSDLADSNLADGGS